MQVFSKIKAALRQIWAPKVLEPQLVPACPNVMLKEAQERIARLERNYIVLLKRVLEMDGVKLITTKASNLDAKIMQTSASEEHKTKGLNEDKPTVH